MKQDPNPKYIRKMLSENRELIAGKNSLKAEHLEAIEEIDLNVQYIEDLCSRLMNELVKLGESDNEASNCVADNPDIPTLSKDYTFRIMEGCSNPAGMDVKSIISEYADRKISTHYRIISNHIDSLIHEDRVYQTNPDHQRGRKYKIKN